MTVHTSRETSRSKHTAHTPPHCTIFYEPAEYGLHECAHLTPNLAEQAQHIEWRYKPAEQELHGSCITPGIAEYADYTTL